MGKITSSVGLVSGIDTGTIINELISLDSQPVTLLQNRVTTANAQSQAYQLLGTQISSLQQIGQSLELPTTFAAATATSSAPTVLSATATAGAAVGTYNFNVASLVTSQQAISGGYASANSLVGAGTLTISQGGGEASSQTTLAQLNGGAGVTRGQFRITDGSGNSAVIDTSTAVTLDDVVNSINSALNVSVHASIDDDHLVLSDASGQTKNAFSVADLGSGTTAAQLGIVGSTTGSTITGANINTISVNSPLSDLNDGRGVGTAGGAADFQVSLSDGSTTAVSIGAAQTVGDVIAAINKAGGSKFNASIDTATNGIKINDTSGGGAGAFSITALSNSTAANDLGIAGSTSGTTLGGNTLIASLDSVLVSSLNGGKGIPLGKIHINDGSGGSADIDLSGARSVQDIISGINDAGLHVTASLNNAGDGIQLQNNGTGGGNLVVSDVNSTTAAALGLAGTYNATQTTVSGGDLHTQYVSGTTLLSDYNGGKGVSPGAFTVTNSKGVSATVAVASGTFNTIGDVINAINAKQIGVTASINGNGDGILLTDDAGGGSKLSVADSGGTTAADLNIAGTATGTTIDGSLTKTIAVSATDTLTTLQQKIAALGFGAGATIVNDGSGSNAYHLAITALNSGRDGRIVIDGGTTSLKTQNIVNAQDATVFYGGSNSGNSLLLTSSTNQLTGVIPGVTVQIQGAGQASLNVALDPSGISTQLQNFTTTFNGLVNEIGTLTQWDTTTNQAGLLLGDGAVQDIQAQLYTAFNSVVNGGQFKLLSDVGLTVNGDGTITFDQDTFNAAYAANPTGVQNLFTQTGTGIGTVIDKSLGELVDPVNGSITREESTISLQVQGFNDQITDLNTLLDDQRNTLEEQFANMEVVLAGLQSQGAALASIGTIGASTTKSSSSSSSSSSNSSSNSSSSGSSS
ncbi:MAG TPA: flagellar filament capping protein FliD [Tepidisphaeraceae bacterium]|jgi:flagellar hook-associated protein 2|nr:flagellar filament capping protein FliD [Tepidisphaeraceae bacterium]